MQVGEEKGAHVRQDAELRGSAVYLHAPPCPLPPHRLKTSRLRLSPGGNSPGTAAGRTSLRGGQGPAEAGVPTKPGSRRRPCPPPPPLRRANSRRCPAVVFPRYKGLGERRGGGGGKPVRERGFSAPPPPAQRRPAGGAGGAEGEAGTEGTKAAAGNKERQAKVNPAPFGVLLQLEPENMMSCRSVSQSWLQLDCPALANTCSDSYCPWNKSTLLVVKSSCGSERKVVHGRQTAVTSCFEQALVEARTLPRTSAGSCSLRPEHLVGRSALQPAVTLRLH
ncbi:uncharacterized protein LOC115350149 [Aquila chrysaetos chrysaetos]|uniref:uncharacterized protein LOC115350149 n=1 Tax=Aquila chrysaetos chrysaetos TaxID=223781 RepID=UPI001176E774|nr:uncharacterized protein LOC115350149 [Aquila chrysaetos chrysaetos]